MNRFYLHTVIKTKIFGKTSRTSDGNIAKNILYIFLIVNFSHISFNILNTYTWTSFHIFYKYYILNNNFKIIIWLNLRFYYFYYYYYYVTVFICLFEFCELHVSHMWKSFAHSQFTRAYPLLPGILIPENYGVLCASLH